MPTPDTAGRTPESAWTIAASLLWAAVILGLLVRAGLHPHRATSLATYLAGGSAWVRSQPLYTDWRGFVYPPVIAWFFSLFTHLPPALAAVLWRLVTAGVFLSGLGALLRSGVFHRIAPGARGLVFLGVLPLSIGNLDNAQANPLVAGLMMLSVAAFQSGAWWLCSVAAAIAIIFKIYPVALALLLCLLRPRQLSWRIALILAGLVLLPFALHDPGYVSGQYHEWLRTRLADDRFQYPMKDAPLDLWYLLVRLGHLPISERVYGALQALGGIALAGWVWRRAREAAPLREIAAGSFLMVSVWMLLLGPATENQTYVVLAPAACLMAAQSLGGCAFFTRGLALSAFALLLAGVGRNSLAPHLKSPVIMALQPVAAVVLLAAVLSDMNARGKIPARAV
jgi:hypothetical protein